MAWASVTEAGTRNTANVVRAIGAAQSMNAWVPAGTPPSVRLHHGTAGRPDGQLMYASETNGPAPSRSQMAELPTVPDTVSPPSWQPTSMPVPPATWPTGPTNVD